MPFSIPYTLMRTSKQEQKQTTKRIVEREDSRFGSTILILPRLTFFPGLHACQTLCSQPHLTLDVQSFELCLDTRQLLDIH